MRDLTTMSRTELAETLRAIPVSEWNSAVFAARRKNAYWRADLSGSDLSGSDLSRSDLSGSDLSGSDLSWSNLSGSNLSGANLRWSDLSRSNLSRSNLSGSNLSRSNLSGSNLNGKPITVTDWCDLLDLAYVGKNLRLAFKRLPDDRVSGQHYKHQVKWSSGRWVECADWKDNAQCGNGLHLSPTPTATRDYSSAQLVIPVAFDPADAVLLGDKIKVRRCKVLG